ncbi:phage tail protein [Pseudodesulfovibrio sp. JC047]|uniref:phage tail protein n=1 Tax=Pseudodesulfovibrio sp. JC047 TaxID=2683199 RepID=UPI0013D25714|nr:phage tail protein [Pseudodesulfovibrio sp. JC047]NDV19996.1 phage tail protein [Pseudodesulfovibrio sp. JC047]
MNLMTFVPPVSPDYPASRSSAANVKTLTFGDGYSQRTPSGLNSLSCSMSLTWSKLVKSEADLIEAFFQGRKGTEAFYWTAPHQEAAQKWVCQKWSRDRQIGPFDSLKASFQEVFDLD